MVFSPRSPRFVVPRHGRRGALVGLLVAMLATVAVSACSGGGSISASSTVAGDDAASSPAGSGLGSSATGDLGDIEVRLTKVAELEAPTAFVARPGHRDQVFIAERAGRIRLATVKGNSALGIAPKPLLDMSSTVGTEGEQGLLGLAFDTAGGSVFISSSEKDGDTRIDVAPIRDNDDGVPSLGKRTKILSVDQPKTTNHKGGNLALGPDGMLYLGLGDGGGQGDPDQRAQDPNDRLGKMLRIDPTRPSKGKAYGIPADNPYVNGGGAPEVFIIGVRNPWRFSFDASNGDLWIADVGQNEREEINRIPAGSGAGWNLGWSRFEGTKVYAPKRKAPGAKPPLFEETHDDGSCSISGGFVYRGSRIPRLDGSYLYSDLCRSGIRGLQSPDGSWDRASIVSGDLGGTDKAEQVISFGTDARNELYVLSLTGTIWRLDAG